MSSQPIFENVKKCKLAVYTEISLFILCNFTFVKSNRIRIAVLLGSISIIGIIVFQLYWVNKSFDLAENQFNQTVEIALYKVAEKMAEFNGHQLPNENPVRQISSNYFIVDINDVIDASILDHYLKTEFEYRNINVDYEYAIYDCETDEMVFGSYFNPSDKSAKITGTFQKYDEFTYYFGIIFPSKTIYILKTMNLWIISTFVLITAIVFFSYAIFIIFRQKRLSEIQKDFINNMTHEFKTPVSTIGISASVLANPEIVNDPGRLKNYAGIILDQNTRLEQQIEKVLQLARLEKNKIKLQLSEINVHAVIASVVSGFKLKLDENEGEIIVQDRAKNPLVSADKIHLTNVIYNLVDNAVKYSGKQTRVIIETREVDSNLEIFVSDNGPGIDKKYQKNI